MIIDKQSKNVAAAGIEQTITALPQQSSLPADAMYNFEYNLNRCLSKSLIFHTDAIFDNKELACSISVLNPRAN